MPVLPYPIDMIVYDEDGTTPLGDVSVTLQNLRTKDKETRTTESDGSCAFDLSNFPNGYESGDDLFYYGIKSISTIAEKFASGTSSVSGTGLNLTLTLRLYIDKSVYPLNMIDKRDIEKRVFDPTARAHRVILIDENGSIKELLKIGNDTDYAIIDTTNHAFEVYLNGSKVWELS